MTEEIKDCLTARELRLVDAENRVRVHAKEDDQGGYFMNFLDNSGVCRVKLGCGKDGVGHVVLGYGDGAPRIALMVGADGSSIATVFDEKLRIRLEMKIDNDGNFARLALHDENQQALVLAGYQNGNGSMATFDKTGKPTWVSG